MKKFVYISLCLFLLLNLVGIFSYRFRLNTRIDKRLDEITYQLHYVQFEMFKSITNVCETTLASFIGEATNGVYFASSTPLYTNRFETISPTFKPSGHRDTIRYNYFTSQGSPWIEINDQYYTVGDEIIGFGLLEKLSRYALRFDDGTIVYNQDTTFTKPLEGKIAKNE